MQQVCARCGAIFRGRWALHVMWCKEDRFFVCRRCWEWECHEGHGKGQQAVGTPTWEKLMILLMVWLLVGTFGAASLADGVRVETYASIPVTQLDRLPNVGLVKVRGTINDTDVIAWSGHEVKTRSSYAWTWNTGDSFRVSDGTGQANVTTGRWWVVESTSHPANTLHTSGTVYLPGDPIFLVAEVATTPTGPVLSALYASPDTFRPEPVLPLAAGIGLSAPFAWALASIFVDRRRRGGLQRERLETVGTKEIGVDTELRDESFPWVANPGMSFRRRVVLTVVAGLIALAVIAALQVASGGLHERAEVTFFPWFTGIVLVFGVVLPTMWALASALRPSAMALTDRGVHFWYDSESARYLADGFVAWDEISFIGVRGSGKHTWHALERKDGVADNVDFLTAANWKALREAWDRRKAAAPVA